MPNEVPCPLSYRCPSVTKRHRSGSKVLAEHRRIAEGTATATAASSVAAPATLVQDARDCAMWLEGCPDRRVPGGYAIPSKTVPAAVRRHILGVNENAMEVDPFAQEAYEWIRKGKVMPNGDVVLDQAAISPAARTFLQQTAFVVPADGFKREVGLLRQEIDKMSTDDAVGAAKKEGFEEGLDIICNSVEARTKGTSEFPMLEIVGVVAEVVADDRGVPEDKAEQAYFHAIKRVGFHLRNRVLLRAAS